MKKPLAAGAIVMTVIVAAAIFVIPALAHGTVAQTNKHTGVGNTGPSPFAAEHQHGTHTGDGDHAAFAFSCAGSGAVKGNRIIAVTESIVNDADSGEAGNYWAFDTTKRSITIWNVGPDQYCAIVNYYDSSFQAIAGQTSPGKGGILSGEEYGSFAGSARFTITGQLYVSDPAVWPTSGKVNGGSAIDYRCDVTGNCPGYVSFLAKYFNTTNPAFTFDEPQWGWRYVGLDSGTKPPTSAGVWINAYTGNSGDILDSDD